MSDGRSFRWTLAAIHVLAVIAIVLVGWDLLAEAGLISLSFSGSAGLAVQVLIVALLVPLSLVASYGIQKRSVLALVLSGVLIVGLVAIAGLGLFVFAAGANRAITEEESVEPLRVGGRLCQPAIPIGVEDPGRAYELRPEIAAAAAAAAPIETRRVWAWESTRTGERVILQVLKGEGASAADFRAFVDGFVSSLPERAPVDHQSVATDQRPYEAVISLLLPGRVAADTRCVTPYTESAGDWIACVTTAGRSHASLEHIRQSLAFAPCGG